MSMLIFYKESLVYSLVDNDDCYVRFLSSLIVKVANYLLKLSNLMVKNLFSHRDVTYSVSVYDEMVRQFFLWMSFCKCMKGILEAIVELLCD